MNYLKHYTVDVEYPSVSGAELLEMLQIRDKLADMEPDLSAIDKKTLLQADYRLIQQSAHFYENLARFVNFSERRRDYNISVERWWWYLDVLAQLPPLPDHLHPDEALSTLVSA